MPSADLSPTQVGLGALCRCSFNCFGVVEGFPGSGKSTIAAFVKNWLDNQGLPGQLYLEGDPDHPADFESVAYFDRPGWDAFLEAHPEYRPVLERQVEWRGDDGFINYRKARHLAGEAIPEDLFAELAQRDVYEVPHPETYRRLARERWQSFAEKARRGDETYVFECCLMQNPLAVLTLKHNRPIPETIGHIRDILALIRPMDPILIYLVQRDPRAAFQRVAAGCPQAWVDFLIAYTEGGGWASSNGLSGLEGVTAYHEQRQAAELALLRQLETPTLIADQSDLDREQGRQKVVQFLSALAPAATPRTGTN